MPVEMNSAGTLAPASKGANSPDGTASPSQSSGGGNPYGPGSLVNTPFGPVDPFVLGQSLPESCAFKMALGGVAGFGLGALFGLFTSSVDFQASMNPDLLKTSTSNQVKVGLKDMGSKSWGMAKQFGVVSTVYTGSECLIQAFRAKDDFYNAVSAGCITGAFLARKSGPRSMALGSLGFAAFSAAVEYYMRYVREED